MNSKILHAALFCPAPEGFWGLPIILWGEPGIGKTHFIKDATTRTGMEYERLSPAERGEGQFGVVPVPHTDGFLHYPAPAWAQRFNKGGVLFLDEINTAPPALQAPMLGLTQLRALGSYQFPTRTRVLAAANETMDAAGGWDLAPALANRFGHFEFEGMSSSDWTIALLGGFANVDDSANIIDAEAEEKRVMEAWPSAFAMASGLVSGFIMRRPELLHKRPEKASSSASRAWPSRRSVHYVATALASARIHNLSEIDTDDFMAAFVGLPWVQEFATWRANMDLPDPADVLDGNSNWKHDGRRLDRTLAVLSSCAALVAPEKAAKKKERGNKLWTMIDSVLKDAADVAIPAARTLTQAKMHVSSIYPAYKPVGDRLYLVLVQAGLAKPV